MVNNPLKQYFRRPSVYFKLPSGGKGYPEGSLKLSPTGELPVYPMTAIDEITSKTPDALFNGTAVTDIIKSCIPDIKDPWLVQNCDIDAILLAIRTASGEDKLDIDTMCPNCQHRATYSISLTNILNTMVCGNYDEEVPIGTLKVKFRPLVFSEMNKANLAQLDVQKIFKKIELAETEDEKTKLSEQALRNLTALTMELVTIAIEYIRTPETIVTEKPFIMEFLQNCNKDDYILMRDYNAKLRATAETKPLDITCTECSTAYKQEYIINPTDFFG